jgi:hypothetical protein
VNDPELILAVVIFFGCPLSVTIADGSILVVAIRSGMIVLEGKETSNHLQPPTRSGACYRTGRNPRGCHSHPKSVKSDPAY